MRTGGWEASGSARMPAQAPPHALQSAHAAAHKFAGAAAAAGTSLMSGTSHASTDMSGSNPTSMSMPMSMSMTFSQSSDVVLLFDWWHPRSGGEYALSLCAIFAICLLQEWLVAQRAVGAAQAASHSSPAESTPLFTEARPPPRRTAVMERAIVHLVYAASVALGFLLMLLVMSFNGGVFLTVVAGLSLSPWAHYDTVTAVEWGAGEQSLWIQNHVNRVRGFR